MSFFLGIDAGGTAAKAAVYDASGCEIHSARTRLENIYPRPGYVERNPEQMWEGIARVICGTIRGAGIPADGIECVSATGFGCGIFLLDDAGHPVRNAIVSSDMRSQGVVDVLVKGDHYDTLQRLAMQRHRAAATVNLIDWIEQGEPEIANQARNLLLCKDYINFRLTGTVGTDVTDSTGGMLASPATCKKNEDLLEEMRLGHWVGRIPNIFKSTDIVGHVSETAAEETGLASGTPVAAGCMDVHAVSLASGVIDNSMLGICLGTWGINFIILAQARQSAPYCLMQMARGIGQSSLVMEGSPDSAVNLDWLLSIMGPGTRVEPISRIACRDTLIDPSNVVYLPHLTGGKGQPKAGFIGVGQETTREHLVRAVMEGVAFRHMDDIDRLNMNEGVAPMSARIVGGAAKNDDWVQLFADCLNITVETVRGEEQGALGAAIIAATAYGTFATQEDACKAMTSVARRFSPNTSRVPIYVEKRYRFQKTSAELAGIWPTWP